MVSDLKTFAYKRCKIAAQKNSIFLANFALQSMVETTLPNGLETSDKGHIANFGIFLEVFEFLRFG